MTSFAFPIRKGMDSDELLDILNKNVAGETRQQLQEVLKDPREDVDYTSLISDLQRAEHQQMRPNGNAGRQALQNWLQGQPAFKVLDADSDKNMALVSKLMIRNDLFGDVTLAHDYYMVGVSDEMHLFMHPLNGCNPARAGNNLRSLMAWMNREDWGFKQTDRMQGDIMMRIESIERVTKGDNLGLKGEISVGPHLFEIGNGKIVHDGKRFEHVMDGETETDGHEIESNHTLKTDGKLFEFSVQDNMLSAAFLRLRPQNVYIVLGGSAVVLEHPEHQTKSLHVPKGHAVLVARQRGENFSTPRAFD